MYRIGRIVLLIVGLAGAAAFADDTHTSDYVGRTVFSVIDEYRAAGLPFVYSTNLVSASMLVKKEPHGTEPAAIVQEILAPHQLTVREEDGFFLVVRMTKAEAEAQKPLVEFKPSDRSVAPVLETITVSTSRYHISRELSNSRYYVDQQTIQSMPDLGEDPLRSAQRVPGTAAGGVSAKTHFRGGEQDETGILLNGQRLLDPFHVRDFRSLFSSIDARAINGVEVYTGGFPVRYGDRLSGLVLIDSLNPDQPNRTELGLSVYNSSFLSAGTAADGEVQWLASARRGNLDLVVDKKYGEPKYYDLFGQISINLSPDTQLSANALFAKDDVAVILSNDFDDVEQNRSNTQNAQFWIRLDNRWSSALTSTSILSLGTLSNKRGANTNDEQKFHLSVDDKRDIDTLSFRQDWTWSASDGHRLQWGLQADYGDAAYDYQSEATYFGLSAVLADTFQTTQSTISASPSGESYSFYVSDRLRLQKRTFAELGLRWDRQAYTGFQSDSQLSPRISLFHALSRDTEFRFSLGRYYQSQGVQELQVEDGLSNFFPAQRSDNIVAGIYHRINPDYSMRIEAFRKDMNHLRPRYENLFNAFSVVPELSPDRVRIAPSRARAQGLEISIEHDADGPLKWWASYTLSEAYDIVNGMKQRRSWDQRHAFLGGVSWSNEHWTAAIVANVHSGWPKTNLVVTPMTDTSGAPVFDVRIGSRNADRFGTFASLDARISRKFDVRRGSLTVFVEASNITDRRNVCCSDYGIEEDDAGNPVFEFNNDYWAPLIPAAGFLWEF